jgi:iron complex transport system substrate-binding protein
LNYDYEAFAGGSQETPAMRICSLLPSATEIVFALGLGDQLVGVSHACDYPAEARSKPVVSQTVRQLSHLSSDEIDAIIRQARANNNPVHWINGDLLRELQPDLILTQELCQVCAIGSGSVFETAAQVLDSQPEIISMRPAGLEDIFQNIRRVGRAAGIPERAEDLVMGLRQRMAFVAEGLGDLAERPKVFCIDWLDPLRNTGQWTPELVELAGGVEGLAEKWGISREIGWEEVLAYQPDYLMVMPCAFNMERTVREAREHLTSQPVWNRLKGVQEHRVFLFDGQIPSRPGPRVLDVLEGLAEAMYPERFAGLAAPGVFQKAGRYRNDAGPTPGPGVFHGTA